MDKRKLIGAALMTVAAGAIAYFAFFRKDAEGRSFFQKLLNAQPPLDPERLIPDGGGKTAPKPSPTEGFPLKQGMKGPKVKEMQDALRTKFNQTNVASDGSFGPITKTALGKAGYPSTLFLTDFNQLIAGKVYMTGTGTVLK
ncbi:MAG: hypothetical protein UV51_C0007G0033 [Candidatus Woesebacteria bacterium GW2011_GWC1_42_9]|nr:MAG: hypothetical protein UV51_C0007G0033 [Candidatus Woesebacteria bacterium GW2011_GWC1_42_9]